MMRRKSGPYSSDGHSMISRRKPKQAKRKKYSSSQKRIKPIPAIKRMPPPNSPKPADWCESCGEAFIHIHPDWLKCRKCRQS
jgi:hypothetical protein